MGVKAVGQTRPSVTFFANALGNYELMVQIRSINKVRSCKQAGKITERGEIYRCKELHRLCSYNFIVVKFTYNRHFMTLSVYFVSLLSFMAVA